VPRPEGELYQVSVGLSRQESREKKIYAKKEKKPARVPPASFTFNEFSA
jgi:hypothetical protein